MGLLRRLNFRDMTDTIVHCGISPYDILSGTLHCAKEACGNVHKGPSGELHSKSEPHFPANDNYCREDDSSTITGLRDSNSITGVECRRVVNPSPKVFEEVIIDGFSILSFRSKADLLTYTRQSEGDRHNPRGTPVEKLNTSRRAAASSKKRSKIRHNHNTISATNSNSLSAYEDQNVNTTDVLSSFVGCPSEPRSPKPSCEDRVPKIDSPHLVSSSKHSSPQAYTDESNEYFGLSYSSNREDLGLRPASSPAVTDDTVAQPSNRDEALFAGSTLNTTSNCHLAPLATTWNHSCAMHPSNSTIANGHWAPTKITDRVAPLMSIEATLPRSEPGLELGHLRISHRPSVSVTRSNPCHQFSVAALTDEPTTTTNASLRIHHSPLGAKCTKSSTRVQRRGNNKRTPVQRSLPDQLPSRGTGFPQPSVTHPSSPFQSSSLSGTSVSVAPNTNFHTQLTVPHPDGGRLHLVSDPASARPPSTGSQASSVRSSPLIPKSRLHASSSRASVSRGWNSPLASVPHPTDTMQSPDPRVLQQLMGIDAETAERLLANTRFNDLYSLTLSTLAGGGTGGGDVRKHPFRSGANDTLNDGNGRSDGSDAVANTCVSSMSSPLATKMSTSTSVPNHITRSSASGGRSHEASVINFDTPCDLNLALTQALLHNAYNDRELVSRLPVPNGAATRKMPLLQPPSGDTSPTRSFPMSHAASLLTHGYLPPPPPLIAGCSQPDGTDSHGFPRTSLSSDVLHRPRLSSLHSSGQHPNTCFSSSSMTTLPLPSSSTQPSELSSHTSQKQWEAFFREKVLTIAASSDSPMGVGPPNLSLSSMKGTVMPSKVPLSTVNSSVGVPQSRTLFDSSATRSLLNPPPPYNTNFLHSGPTARPPLRFDSAKGAPEHTKRQLTNLLRQPVHTCGRWADAHIRIARYIEHQQLLLGSRAPCDGFSSIGLTSSSSSRCPIRPIPRPIPPLLSRSSGLTSFSTLQGSAPSSQLPNPITPARPPLNVHPSLDTRTQQPPSSASSNFVPDGAIDSNAFFTRLFNGMLSSMPTEWTSNGHFFPKEMSEMLWNSALQKFYGHPVASQGQGQSRPPWAINGSPSSVLDLTHSVRDPFGTFFAPGIRPRAPDPPGLFVPPCVSVSASSYHSLPSTFTNSQSATNTKRRRLDAPPLLQPLLSSHPSHPDLPLVPPSLSVPLHPQTSRPPLDLLTPTVQKHASQLNGCHMPDLSERWNPSNPFARIDANYSNCAENNLKLPAPPSHLAPIHPW